jgi:hypothetical protein
MKIRVYRNTSDKRFGFARLPIRQTLVWAGPLFFLIRR